jgi:hypothetical protein
MHSLSWIDCGNSELGADVFNCITSFVLWCLGEERRRTGRAGRGAIGGVGAHHLRWNPDRPSGRISNVNTLLPATSFPVPLKAAGAAGLVPSSSTQEANHMHSAQQFPENNETT